MRYLLFLFLASCASVQVPNTEICIELPSRDAFCSNTLFDDERRIPKDEWQTMTPGRFSMSAEDFAKYQSFIEAACVKFTCTEEQKKILTRLKELHGTTDK